MRTYIPVLLIASLSACSHGPVVQDFADSADPAAEVAKFDTDMGLATQNQWGVLAPDSFKEARSSLESAKKGLAHPDDAKGTLHNVAEGRAYLARAGDFAALSKTNMDEVVLARRAALTAGADGAFASDFQDADHQLMEVTSRFENGDLTGAAEKRGTLQASYLGLELKAIEQTRLGPAHDRIEQAKKEGAKEFAPRSLAIAEKSVNDAQAFIIANRHDTVAVLTVSDTALTNADHLLKITRDSKAGKKTTSEDAALTLENEKDRVDVKTDQLNTQKQETRTLAIDNNALAVDNHVLAANNHALQADQDFNRSFDEARAQFTESEAQVYKQGDTLMIRLRGLEFPASQSVLRGDNFPLLAKVQKVIRDFGKSTVVIEGHTDSHGGKVLNEKLSNDRADAVRKYLVSNAGPTPLSITSIGYDYQKPLATNKTAAGRAQNRRVDVLITAERPAPEKPVGT